jgi:membrane protein
MPSRERVAEAARAETLAEMGRPARFGGALSGNAGAVTDTRTDQDTQEPREDPHEVGAIGWWQALRRTPPRLKELNIGLLASGVAFWGVLSIFPALIALVLVYGLVASPEQVTQQVGGALDALSEDARAVVTGRLEEIAAQRQGLGIGLAITLAGLLWSISGGMQNLMKAITTAHEQRETRGTVALRLRAILLSVGTLVLGLLVIAAVGVAPALLRATGLSGPLRWLALGVGYAVLFLVVLGAIGLLYRFGPANQPVGWRWASSGAVIAGILVLVVTVGFALYVNLFGNYANIYGTLVGVIVLMLWLYYSAFGVLLGALVNAEAQREAKGDAPSRPEGEQREIVRAPSDA